MYRIIFGNIALAGLMITVALGTLNSQDRTIISGLASDSTYMLLVEQERDMKLREDSLNSRVAQTRSLFRTDPDNRSRYSDDIIKLEAEIFDIRNLIGITAGKINTIEQEYIIRNLSDAGQPGQGPAGGTTGGNEEVSPVLVLNPLFANNLPAEDYRTLVRAQKMEMDVLDKIATFESNYRSILRVAEENEAVDNPQQADSLYSLYETLTGLNRQIDGLIGEEFGFIYDNKLFSYNYILDKLGRRSQLAAFEKKITATLERTLAAEQGAMSPAIAAYPHRKALLAEYEETLASIAGYDRSLDSLRRTTKAIAGTNFDFPDVPMEEKLFLDYADIEFHNPAKYNTRNPVPEVIVHPKGEIFRILLGTFQKAQPVSILKGAWPVGVYRDEGKYAYYAGGFATAEAASEALETLKGKGFRDPKVGYWNNGRLDILSQQVLDRKLGKATEGLFRISVDTGGKPLPEAIREIIEDLGPGAEISRSGNLYIIGTFDSRDEAEEIADEIEDTVDGVEVKIENVG